MFQFSSLKNLFNPAEMNLVKSSWDRLHRLPGGKRVFSKGVGRVAPYTGSIPASIEELRAGYARVTLEDIPKVRNHLQSIHAVALANLAELTGNIALSYSMPADARFIVTQLKMEYLKKARGKLQAVCNCPIPESSKKESYEITVEIFDSAEVLVSRCVMSSLLGPKKAAAS